MENEYQLRLKDMSYGEKIKELTDKLLQEIESLKAKNAVCTCTRHTFMPRVYFTVSLMLSCIYTHYPLITHTCAPSPLTHAHPHHSQMLQTDKEKELTRHEEETQKMGESHNTELQEIGVM